MKRFGLLTFVGLLAVVVMMMASCGGGPEEVTPEVPVDTAPPAVEEPEPEPEEPPPPPPELKESQLETVYFDFDKYNLRPDAKASLDLNFNLLQQFSDVIVKIEGHCDERGTIEYNLSLGEKRAKATQDYLVGWELTLAGFRSSATAKRGRLIRDTTRRPGPRTDGLSSVSYRNKCRKVHAYADRKKSIHNRHSSCGGYVYRYRP
ncbi:MAG: OmpA family protein [Candidatus Zixiibacteriota bacterium]|nr:MAG: OmpA family protein [candidate division Zixibacteria bacterium]